MSSFYCTIYLNYWIERNCRFSTKPPATDTTPLLSLQTTVSLYQADRKPRKTPPAVPGQSLSLENGTMNVRCFHFLSLQNWSPAVPLPQIQSLLSSSFSRLDIASQTPLGIHVPQDGSNIVISWD